MLKLAGTRAFSFAALIICFFWGPAGFAQTPFAASSQPNIQSDQHSANRNDGLDHHPDQPEHRRYSG